MQRQMEIRPGAGLDIEGPARAHGDLNRTNDLQIERSTKGVDRRERAMIAIDCFD
jgi:hypothetical protein